MTEMSTEIEYINHVVIGVGINVNTEAFPEEICATATSIRREIRKDMETRGADRGDPPAV